MHSDYHHAISDVGTDTPLPNNETPPDHIRPDSIRSTLQPDVVSASTVSGLHPKLIMSGSQNCLPLSNPVQANTSFDNDTIFMQTPRDLLADLFPRQSSQAAIDLGDLPTAGFLTDGEEGMEWPPFLFNMFGQDQVAHDVQDWTFDP